jgi:hypothetical protein
MERRSSKRPRVDLMINKYIDGYPYACRAVDISKGGVLLERIHEPKHDRTFYPVEIAVPGVKDRIWAWTRQVRASGRSQALRFVAMDPFDQILLDQYVDQKSR